MGLRAFVLREYRELGDPLRGAHHARRVYRFVGGDQDKVFDVVLDRKPGQDLRPDHVIEHGLRRVQLHQGDVFIGRGMDHNLRFVTRHQDIHTRLVRHVRNARYETLMQPTELTMDEE